jgi:hypothetical protein
LPSKTRLALTRFETLLGFVDDINAAFTAHDLAIPVPVLQGTQRISDLHGQLLLSGRETLPKNLIPCERDGGRNWD